MAFSAVNSAYCTLGDVQARLYTGQGNTGSVVSPGAPKDDQRDSYLNDLIVDVSRRFDDETGRHYGAFVPVYEARFFGGRGAQTLDVDDFAFITKVESNTMQGQANPVWQDLTGDFATGLMQTLPIRFWPKTQIWRMRTFITDAFRIGNIKLTGIWGTVVPDLEMSVPQGPWEQNASLTQAQINAMAPDAATPAGWWRTPNQVRKAVAEWVVYSYHASRAGYSEQVGNTANTPGQMYRKGVPPEVEMVIARFRNDRPHLALITIDGVDVEDERTYPNSTGMGGNPTQTSRWAGWLTN